MPIYSATVAKAANPTSRSAPGRSTAARRLAVLLFALAAAGTGCVESQARRRAAESDSIFAMFTPPSPVDASNWAVDDWDADKRVRGTILLANSPFGGEEVYVAVYRAKLDPNSPEYDPDSLGRAAAIRALSLHGDPQDVPAIAANLTDDDRTLRWEASRALQRIHNPEAVRPLIDRLTEDKEPDPLVRAAAADALGQYADRSVLIALITALDDRDLAVNRAAERSLEALTAKRFGLDVAAWDSWRRSTQDPFAERNPYQYPVFRRDRDLFEWIIPFYGQPPNEIAAAPVGMPGQAKRVAPADRADQEDGSDRTVN